MSGNIRSKTFVELVNQRTPIDARSDLEVYSIAQTDAAISVATAGIDLSLYTLLSTTESISGGLDSRLDVAEADIVALETLTQDISGNLSIDISNLDLAFTQKISEDCMQSEGISGSSTTVNGYLNITINGVSYKIATIA